jgi:DNA-binding transcriptional LysR family regulator
MLTKMCNTRSSCYPLMDVAEDGVDGVISLDCLVDSWVWRPLFFILLVLIICISPLIIAVILRWLICLFFSFINLSLVLILGWWRYLCGGGWLSAFRDPGVPGPTSEMSPRAPAQMGRRQAEREGGR